MKKFRILIYILMVVQAVSCDKKTIKIVSYHDNGAQMFEGFLCGDKLCGLWSAYSESGRVLWRGEFLGDVPVGNWTDDYRFMLSDYPVKIREGWCRFTFNTIISKQLCGLSRADWVRGPPR